NFFDLGGDSLLAVQMLDELRVRTGHEIRTPEFSENPTVEGVASLLRAVAPERGRAAGAGAVDRAVPANPCLAPLRSTGAQPPSFCLRPIGGGTLCYTPLARATDPDRPFWGLQSPMLEDPSACPGSLEGLASLYVDAIRSVQPAGPYLLGGWS